MADQRQAAGDLAPHTLWFSPPGGDQSHRRVLTRQRVIAEALAVISADGVQALSMRALAARLGVVPGALYRHVRSKEQLYDLVLDDVLAEVDCQADHSLDWTGQVTALAQRLRAVLENHPGIAGLLKTRDPLSPHSLALAEAFLAPLHAAGMAERQTALDPKGRAVHREDIEFTKNIQGYSLLSKVVHPSDFSSCSHDRERRLAAMY
jgi:AcrR family transcriptional regulator